MGVKDSGERLRVVGRGRVVRKVDGITVRRLSYLDTLGKSAVFVYSTLYMSSRFTELTQLQMKYM